MRRRAPAASRCRRTSSGCAPRWSPIGRRARRAGTSSAGTTGTRSRWSATSWTRPRFADLAARGRALLVGRATSSRGRRAAATGAGPLARAPVRRLAGRPRPRGRAGAAARGSATTAWRRSGRRSSPSAAMPRRCPSSAGWSASSRCTRAGGRCTRWRCTAAGGRPTRWSALRGARGVLVEELGRRARRPAARAGAARSWPRTPRSTSTRRRAVEPRSRRATATVTGCPYKGLARYEAADAAVVPRPRPAGRHAGDRAGGPPAAGRVRVQRRGQVVGGAGRPGAGAPCRRPARERGVGAAGGRAGAAARRQPGAAHRRGRRRRRRWCSCATSWSSCGRRQTPAGERTAFLDTVLGLLRGRRGRPVRAGRCGATTWAGWPSTRTSPSACTAAW